MSRKGLQLAGVLLAGGGFIAFTLMDAVPDYSQEQDLFQAVGYLLCFTAILVFARSLWKPTA